MRRLLLFIALFLLAPAVKAQQSCSLQDVGGEEFTAIDGSSDSEVWAVTTEGEIRRYDGSSWSSVSSPEDDDFYDVTVIGNTAFAVGEEGLVVTGTPGSMTEIGGFTDDELLAVWGDSTSEVYAGGQNGVLRLWNGSSWSNLRGAADVGDDDIVDIYGNANFVYVVDSEGEVYRRDRSTGDWWSPSKICGGDTYTGVWVDSSDNAWFTAKDEVYRYDGSSCSLQASTDEDLLSISGSSAEGRVIAVGKNGRVLEFDGTSWNESQVGSDEIQGVWMSEAGNAYLATKESQLSTCTCTDCSGGGGGGGGGSGGGGGGGPTEPLVCTEFDTGSGNTWRGVDGFSDSNVIAVGNDGDARRYDGTTWNEIPSITSETLLDVDTSGGLVVATGRRGTVLTMAENSSSWTSIGGMTTRQMNGVWAASANEIWVAGSRQVWFWNGSSWSNQSGAAGFFLTTIADIWGNDDAVYLLSTLGVIYSYNRNTSSWNSADFDCFSFFAGTATDLWGNASGDIFISRDDDVYQYTGSSCPLLRDTNEGLQGISGSDGSGKTVAVGDNGFIGELESGVWTDTTLSSGRELYDVWVSEPGNVYTVADNRMLYSCVCPDCAAGNTPQFVVNHDNYGINCLAENVDVQVQDSGTSNPITTYTEQITLDTQTGRGTWSLVTGSGAFNDAIANDGLATYTWPSGESTATFSLFYPEGAPTFDVDAFQTSDTGVRDIDDEGNIEFSASGFTVTSTALGNPPPLSITSFNTAQTAGAGFVVHIAAYGQTPTDPQCGIIEAYTGGKNLDFWLTRSNPSSGTITSTIDDTPIGVGEGAATNLPVTFTNGQAAVTGKYKDAGQIQVSMKDTSPADPNLAGGIRGATAGFVVRPFEFRLSNIEDSGGSSNPAASSGSGTAFVPAGEVFSATVTAYDAEGDVTPNFGQEASAEGVILSSNLVAPSGGNNPALANADAFGSFSSGVATGTTFSWPEVGIITLTPSVADGDYLGSGDVTGQTTGNVGRFTAHHFDTTQNVPAFGTACSAGSFSYVGESFGYSIEPVITFTAKALGGETTQNYEGDFFRMSGLASPVYTSSPASLDVSGLLSGGASTVAETGAGVGTLTFGSGSGLLYSRSAEEAPFIANIQLSQSVVDADGAAATSNPVVFGSPTGILFDNGAEMRFGRARLLNAFGSELVDLPVTLRTEYYVDANTGFIPNTVDNCSVTAGVTLDLFTDNLASGETCVLDTGAPGVSGAGCPTAALPGLRFSSPATAGSFNLTLAAPGDGNDGSTRISADVPAWLEFDWDAGNPGDEDPSGNATFGIFEGSDRRIYTREVY